jgi:IS5 family transposase
MRPAERHDSGQHDLLRSRLDQIIDLAHPLAKLEHGIDWGFLDRRLGASSTDRPGRPPVATHVPGDICIGDPHSKAA